MSDTPQSFDAESRRKEWIARLAPLMETIGQWAAEQGWPISDQPREISERLLGTYQAPGLRVRTPSGDLLVEPVARHVIGGDGRVDLTAWPSLNRVKLVGHDDGWRVFTDSNLAWPKPWCKDTFLELARGLAAAA